MTDQLGPNPGFVFSAGATQAGEIFVTELVRIVNKKQTTAITDLNQTITNPPTQAEVQAISDKIDEILAALRVAGLVEET